MTEPPDESPPDPAGLKLWSLMLHLVAIVIGIAIGVSSFQWITK